MTRNTWCVCSIVNKFWWKEMFPYVHCTTWLMMWQIASLVTPFYQDGPNKFNESMSFSRREVVHNITGDRNFLKFPSSIFLLTIDILNTQDCRDPFVSYTRRTVVKHNVFRTFFSFVSCEKGRMHFLLPHWCDLNTPITAWTSSKHLSQFLVSCVYGKTFHHRSPHQQIY